ncbi:MAG: hypothetical protein F4039_01435 [Gammaproteobacteria bacterium]|nr:hypothetical protein [Gammaproteobacteria bacterium]
MTSFVRRLALTTVVTAVLVFGGLLVLDNAHKDTQAASRPHHHDVYHDEHDVDSGYWVHNTVDYVYR